MREYLHILKACRLFNNLQDDDILAALSCLNAKVITFKKDNNIFECIDSIKMGVLLVGKLQNIQIDYKGNQNIIATFFPTDIFGETLACVGCDKTDINIIASSDCEILFMDYNRIVSYCSKACMYHQVLIDNMLKIIAAKNIYLNKKMQVITKRTTREKIMCYLKQQQISSKQQYFEIPLLRQEMADYLSVERTAMSAELGKLRDEGIISFQKNQFRIHENTKNKQ